MWIKVLLIYLLTVNLLTMLVYAIDKRKAKKNAHRISEKALLLWALLGGSIGALLGMRIFRHKTKHKKFTIGVPMILICQIAIVVWLLWTFASEINFA